MNLELLTNKLYAEFIFTFVFAIGYVDGLNPIELVPLLNKTSITKDKDDDINLPCNLPDALPLINCGVLVTLILADVFDIIVGRTDVPFSITLNIKSNPLAILLVSKDDADIACLIGFAFVTFKDDDVFVTNVGNTLNPFLTTFTTVP
jgi:hypothetical protein